MVEVFKQARGWGRLFGGSAVLLGCDDKRSVALPLIPERAKNLDWLMPLDKRYLWPMSYYSDMGPKFGKPETFMFSPMSATGAHLQTVIHESRLVLFPGDASARLEKDINQGWDLSVLQRIHPVLMSHDTSWKALEIMLTESQQAVFHMTGLAEGIAGGETDALKARMQIIDMYRSMLRAMVIDADAEEKFERNFATFTGVADAMDKIVLRLASAMRMPVTILMGQSPAGMNATGVSDLSIWYNFIASSQTQVLDALIRRVVEVFCATKEGPDLPKSDIAEESVVKVVWPSLWTESPIENAQRRSALMTSDVAGVNAGIYLPEEVALTRTAPDGWDGAIKLTDAGRKAREQSVTDEFEKILNPPQDASAAAVNIELAPTDVAKAVTLNEARASQGLPPSIGPDGDKPLAEIGAPAAGGFGGAPAKFDGHMTMAELQRLDSKLFVAALDVLESYYRADAEDQPRDELGRFGEGSGGSSGGLGKASSHGAGVKLSGSRKDTESHINSLGLANAKSPSEGMSETKLAAARDAFKGLSPDEATAVATGERDVAELNPFEGQNKEGASAAQHGKLPPIRVQVEHTGKVSIIDGRHRMQAATEAGARQIKAVVTQLGARGGSKEFTGKFNINAGRSDWNEDQPRDELGRFGEGGGGSSGGGDASKGTGGVSHLEKEGGYSVYVKDETLRSIFKRDLTAHETDKMLGLHKLESELKDKFPDAVVEKNISTDHSGDRENVSIDYNVHDKDGKSIVKIEREFTRNDDGELEVKHEYFILDDKLAGQGLGREMLRDQADSYAEMGGAEVKLVASLNVGRYVWLRAGFQPDEKSLEDLHSHYSREMAHRSGIPLPDMKKKLEVGLTQPWRFAAMKWEGKNVGKEIVMKGPEWHGSLKVPAKGGESNANYDQFQKFLNKE
jgi:phage-related protein (TIGR01555 family)